MPTFLDTSGNPTLGIAICDRCKLKFPTDKLHPDKNTPGLMVCDADNDDFDPWRLPARQTENITLPYYRPDVPIGVTPEAAAADTYRVTEVDDFRQTQDDDYRIIEVNP